MYPTDVIVVPIVMSEKNGQIDTHESVPHTNLIYTVNTCQNQSPIIFFYFSKLLLCLSLGHHRLHRSEAKYIINHLVTRDNRYDVLEL